MMVRTLVLVLTLAALTSAHSGAPQQRTTVFDQLVRRPPPVRSAGPPRASEELWITQKLDHYNVLDTRTWQQRYFLSRDTYQPGGPVFLYLSGEWIADGSQVTDSFIGELAAQHGALMINLEHRYYGESHPTPDTSTENLKYLSTDQALEDAAVFTMTLKADPELNLTGPWIVFGASYSAQMSAWSRARYPHLYYAALSSSAPVWAQLDIPEYMEVVGDALLATSADCPGVITAAMNELFALVDQGDDVRITELFNLCGLVDLSEPESMMSVYLYIAGLFAYEVQYARFGNLDNICSVLLDGQATPLDTMARIVSTAYAPACLVTDKDFILDYFRNHTYWSKGVLREYYYQLCTEYGHYNTLSSPDQPFGQVIPVEFFLLWCPEVYGPQFNRELNEAGINRTNLVNGGYTPDVTRVLYTQGSLDPWHPFGIQTDLNEESPVIMIERESHCRDLDSSSEMDSQPLKDARVRITQIIEDWVMAAKL